MLVISLHPNKLRTSQWMERWNKMCPRWGWTSGIFAQIQPLVLSPSRMLRASKIRCNSQLHATCWRCWKPVPDGGFQTSQKTSYFQTFLHWCVQEWGGFIPSVWPFFRWNGWNECFPEFSVPNPYANYQLGVHQFTRARWCVVCWFVGPRDTMQGTQSSTVGSRGRSNQRNTSSQSSHPFWKSSTDTPKWPKEFGHLGVSAHLTETSARWWTSCWCWAWSPPSPLPFIRWDCGWRL